jgi:hypothetical protein
VNATAYSSAAADSDLASAPEPCPFGAPVPQPRPTGAFVNKPYHLSQLLPDPPFAELDAHNCQIAKLRLKSRIDIFPPTRFRTVLRIGANRPTPSSERAIITVLTCPINGSFNRWSQVRSLPVHASDYSVCFINTVRISDLRLTGARERIRPIAHKSAGNMASI